jgi:hypothetical protein
VVGSMVAMESLDASPRTPDWPSGRRHQRGSTTIGVTARGGNSAGSGVAVISSKPSRANVASA